MKLNKKQMDFLNIELNIQSSDLDRMSAEQWKCIREKCFYIEADELMDMEDDENDTETERCRLATSIANIRFSELEIE